MATSKVNCLVNIGSPSTIVAVNESVDNNFFLAGVGVDDVGINCQLFVGTISLIRSELRNMNPYYVCLREY
jgi:hypothetical protein